MTSHAAAIGGRLPTLYQDGDLVRGLVEVLALQLEVLDEEARIIQRAHWFDTTVELAEAAGLAALLDIPAEPWQQLDEYRAWVHALRDARLRFGAVTIPAIKEFSRRYVADFTRANRITAVAPLAEGDDWGATFRRAGNSFVENPPRRATLRMGGPGALEPLQRSEITNRGMADAPLSALFTGGSLTEYGPVLSNRTTGEALVFLGELRPGDRLWLSATANGSLTAQLNRADVTAMLRFVRRVIPGQPWEPADVSPARALTLRPGRNDLWFLPVAHFDSPGLDRALLALAALDLTAGRFDSAAFDHAVFFLDPAANLDLSWVEQPAASFRVDLDGGTMRSPAGALEAAFEARDQLAVSTSRGVASLAAAGVANEVRLRPLHDSQRQLDHLTFISGIAQHEIGTVGIDQLVDAGGLFGITSFGESTYQ